MSFNIGRAFGIDGDNVQVEGHPNLVRHRELNSPLTIAIRVALAALGAFAAYSGGSLLILGVLGLLLSPPSLALAAGAYCVYSGVTAVVSSVASGSLLTLGWGLLLSGLGLALLRSGLVRVVYA